MSAYHTVPPAPNHTVRIRSVWRSQPPRPRPRVESVVRRPRCGREFTLEKGCCPGRQTGRLAAYEPDTRIAPRRRDGAIMKRAQNNNARGAASAGLPDQRHEPKTPCEDGGGPRDLGERRSGLPPPGKPSASSVSSHHRASQAARPCGKAVATPRGLLAILLPSSGQSAPCANDMSVSNLRSFAVLHDNRVGCWCDTKALEEVARGCSTRSRAMR